jgi:hypothetical protein
MLLRPLQVRLSTLDLHRDNAPCRPTMFVNELDLPINPNVN